MKLLQLGKGVYQYYTKNVKDNEGLNNSQVQRKLTRNSVLAREIDLGNSQYIYLYGKLNFFVDNGKVVWVTNMREVPTPWFKKDMAKYRQLNEELGIK